jgi:hypothetical protein
MPGSRREIVEAADRTHSCGVESTIEAQRGSTGPVGVERFERDDPIGYGPEEMGGPQEGVQTCAWISSARAFTSSVVTVF